MSCILYYSTYCPNSKKLLTELSKSSIKKEIHFINIDNRTKKADGSTVIQLQNGQELLLPPSVTKVPALLLLNRGHQVLFGEEIKKYLKPMEVNINTSATNNNQAPLAYSLSDSTTSGYGVASDNYSFWDQSAEELTAKGNGGMRQAWHYSSIEDNHSIETPPDTYTPDKVKEDTYKKFQSSRENEINSYS